MVISSIKAIILFHFILTEIVKLHSVNWLYQFYRTVRTLFQQYVRHTGVMSFSSQLVKWL